jgi:hypothetical protein
MIKYICFGMFMVGCAGSAPVVNSPATAPVAAECAKDNFDIAGSKVAQGSRWVWHKTIDGYEWATSEDTRNKAIEYFEAVKNKVK